MDKTVLVESDIQHGEAVLNVLREAGYPVRSALWAYAPEKYSEWRLVIAPPLVDEQGPFAAYRKLDAVLRKKDPNLSTLFQRIQVVGPGSPLIRSLEKAYPRGKPLFDPLISGSTSVPHVDQAYLYSIHGRAE